MGVCAMSLKSVKGVAGASQDVAYRCGPDPRTAAAHGAGWDLWRLGVPDQARRVIADTLRWARQHNLANTTDLARCDGVSLLHVWLWRAARLDSAARAALSQIGTASG